jgi:hypothetical protein
MGSFLLPYSLKNSYIYYVLLINTGIFFINNKNLQI